jgi:hypothetical protein
MENNNKQKGQRKLERTNNQPINQSMFDSSFSNETSLHTIQMVHNICFLYFYNHKTQLNEIRRQKVDIFTITAHFNLNILVTP